MKKTLLITSLAILISKLSLAQITLNSSDFPVAGDAFAEDNINNTSKLSGLNPGSAGQGVTWDFSNLPAKDKRDTSRFITPANSDFGSQFPLSNLVEVKYDQETYLDNNASGLKIHGLTKLAPVVGAVPFKLNTPLTIINFPVNYGNANKSEATGYFKMAYQVLIYDSARVDLSIINRYVVDGEGEIHTPEGIYPALRILSKQSTTLKTYVRNMYTKQWSAQPIDGIDGTYNTSAYSWWTNGLRNEVLSFTYNSDSTTTNLTQVDWNINAEVITSNVKSLNGSELTLSPNPAENSIQLNGLNGNTSTIKIFNELGIEVFNSKNYINEQQIDISNLEKGFYTLSINSEADIVNKKFIKK